jgi:hypothetical protein
MGGRLLEGRDHGILSSCRIVSACPGLPGGPVKFITQLAAGGGTDPAMRIVVDQLGKIWSSAHFGKLIVEETEKWGQDNQGGKHQAGGARGSILLNPSVVQLLGGRPGE